jgi:hypothetical protein
MKTNTICLLLGLAWANAYLITMQLDPSSFQSSVSLSSFYVSEWYYYSYVILTTVGYGEITPLSQTFRRRSFNWAALSRRLNREIDWHRDHHLPAEFRARL